MKRTSLLAAPALILLATWAFAPTDVRPAPVTSPLADLPVPARWVPSEPPRAARAAFSVQVGGVDVPLRVMALAALPDEEIEIAGTGTGGALTTTAGGGTLAPAGPDRWIWTAPGHYGFHAVQVVSHELRDTIDLTFMVERPATDVTGGSLGGYEIGAYRARPASMSAAYEPPRGFVEARPEDYDILVSPNFRLGQFLCKEPGDPRYLVVSPPLLVKLEALLVAVNEAGYPAESLTVMSGFRTPAYNRAIGNTTDFSRHLWGDAADVFVDNDGDARMDDVNHDGRSDLNDARWLAGVVENMMASKDSELVPGGLSAYKSTSAHGPFVHMDARGRRARW